MKRLLTAFFATLLTTAYTAADDHTMIISLSDGSVYAIHNKSIKSIGFSKYDLNEKYYVLKTDTLMVRDTIIDIETIYDTVYIDKPYAVYDTVYVDKEIVKHDTIYVEEGKTTYTIDGVEYPMPDVVDLGLPSGNKWASCDLGSKSNDIDGLKFTWGNSIHIEGGRDSKTYILLYLKYKNEYYRYIWDESKYPYENIEHWDGKFNDDMNYIKKYLGDSWTTPSKEDFEELIKFCDYSEYIKNGIPKIKFKSRTNYEEIEFTFDGDYWTTDCAQSDYWGLSNSSHSIIGYRYGNSTDINGNEKWGFFQYLYISYQKACFRPVLKQEM